MLVHTAADKIIQDKFKGALVFKYNTPSLPVPGPELGCKNHRIDFQSRAGITELSPSFLLSLTSSGILLKNLISMDLMFITSKMGQ